MVYKTGKIIGPPPTPPAFASPIKIINNIEPTISLLLSGNKSFLMHCYTPFYNLQK